MKKRSLIIILLLTFLALPLSPKAATTFGDALDELDALRAKKEAKENEKQLTEAEYNRIQAEIGQIETDIAKLSNEIQEATRQIEKLGKDIENKKEETNEILLFLQLSSGEKSYLEYIFKAKSFTDFIHRVSIVEQLGKYNKEQIAEMNDMIKKNNELKKQNAENIEKQKVKKQESQKKMEELGDKINELMDGQVEVDKQIEKQENYVNMLRNDGCSNRNDLISVCAKMITDTGFLRPTTYGIVTDEYGWRTVHPTLGTGRMHSGIDIGVSENTPVYPVANGIIKAKYYYTSCGGNQLYITHYVNGQEYTSVYMHLNSFNENYQEGDIVTSDTVVAYSGGGPSTEWYDGCTAGAHLHLTLQYGHQTGLYATFNPREVIDFPGLYASWWWTRYW